MTRPTKILLLVLTVLLTGFHLQSQQPIPEPFAEVGGKSSGTIKSASLRAQFGVLAYIDEARSHKIKVTSFTLTIKREKQISFVKQNVGNRFSNECSTALAQVQPGDEVDITEIKAKDYIGTPRSLKAIELTVIR